MSPANGLGKDVSGRVNTKCIDHEPGLCFVSMRNWKVASACFVWGRLRWQWDQKLQQIVPCLLGHDNGLRFYSKYNSEASVIGGFWLEEKYDLTYIWKDHSDCCDNRLYVKLGGVPSSLRLLWWARQLMLVAQTRVVAGKVKKMIGVSVFWK